MQAEDDRFLDGQSLARICFVRQGKAGEPLVFIRIPPAMYRFAKMRSRIKRGNRIIRVLLRPRHHLALEKTTDVKHRKVMLRLSAERLRNAKGLKGHYAVRPLSQFKQADASDG